MGYEFDRDTAVTSTGAGTGTATGTGEYAASLAPGWMIGGGINGGYLLAVVGAALRAASPGKPDPVVVSAHYLSASVPGPATVSTRVLRDGAGPGSLASLAAEVTQDGVPRISALATYADLGRLPDDVRTTATEPVLPAVEDCVPSSLAPEDFRRTSPLLDRLDLRLDPAHAGWAVGEPSGAGEIQGWLAMADGREPDPLSLLLALDSLPPVTFDLGMPGWAPTLELTAHVRARPAPGWLKVRHATRNLAGGLFEEDCEVWDSAGRLVAQSRQLAKAPRSRT
ncbi:thioesterase family protein [Nocardioides donggukensis]|uniref:Thioesterase family protein n=1 Tax=Nocardioides donggukensis TaxID=2774019 RepID=A0A927K9N1_9ACTN|nr:thioesterase family protein [Nocardioides donggukensis]MBD8870326.1 thioesterase family protein [Nocardioides donggukensis]